MEFVSLESSVVIEIRPLSNHLEVTKSDHSNIMYFLLEHERPVWGQSIDLISRFENLRKMSLIFARSKTHIEFDDNWKREKFSPWEWALLLKFHISFAHCLPSPFSVDYCIFSTCTERIAQCSVFSIFVEIWVLTNQIFPFFFNRSASSSDNSDDEVKENLCRLELHSSINRRKRTNESSEQRDRETWRNLLDCKYFLFKSPLPMLSHLVSERERERKLLERRIYECMCTWI